MAAQNMKLCSVRIVLVLALLCSFVGVSGCANALFTAAYLIKGGEVDPEFKDEIKAIPKKSRMAVICRSRIRPLRNRRSSKTLSIALTKALSERSMKKKVGMDPDR